ncbi:unnamed protein product [Ectocarpus sp. 13 AM-2016]
MKSESLVIAGQNTAVNTFPGLVHTARHTMGVTLGEPGVGSPPYQNVDGDIVSVVPTQIVLFKSLKKCPRALKFDLKIKLKPFGVVWLSD